MLTPNQFGEGVRDYIMGYESCKPSDINKNKEKLDICTYNMAMFYLLLAYENNYEQSKYFVEQIFGNNKIPHSETYKKKFCY
jgi:hypothetical protein